MANLIKTSNRPRRKQVKSDEEMNGLMQATGRALLDRAMRAYANKLHNNILDLLYNKYTPKDGGKYYDRTWDFLRAITIKKPYDIYKGKIMQAVVYIDYKQLRINESRKPGMWGRHISVKGEPFAKSLIEVLEEGTNNSKSLFQRDGAHFIEETNEWFMQYADMGGLTALTKNQRSYNGDDGPTYNVPNGIRIRKRK